MEPERKHDEYPERYEIHSKEAMGTSERDNNGTLRMIDGNEVGDFVERIGKVRMNNLSRS